MEEKITGPQPSEIANPPNENAENQPPRSPFDQVPEDKRARIIAAALKAFAAHGYRKASTEHIAREAEISKSLLFHYFKNKEGLFLALFEYCTDRITQAAFAGIDEGETDFFALMLQITRLKIEIMTQDANLYPFVLRAWEEERTRLGEQFEQIQSKFVLAHIAGLMARVDRHKFIPEVNPQMVMDIIRWTAEGYMAQAMRAPNVTAQQLIDAFIPHLLLFRKRFYREEYQ